MADNYKMLKQLVSTASPPPQKRACQLLAAVPVQVLEGCDEMGTPMIFFFFPPVVGSMPLELITVPFLIKNCLLILHAPLDKDCSNLTVC